MTKWLCAMAFVGVVAFLAVGCATSEPTTDPLPSWNDGPRKQAVLDFVAKVTREGGPDFVPGADRIAVFDNDGTLWSEQPFYNQMAFALDQVKLLVKEHPEWKEKLPFKAALEGDLKAIMSTGMKGVIELVLATHANQTADEFEATAKKWISSARHPRFKRPYTECVYQPMLELLAHLRSQGFKIFIVSGGGVDFMRPWTQKVYGIPPEQVIGSSMKTRYEEQNGKPILSILPEVDFVNDKAGKPVGIHRAIGKRPIMVFGNSDGDYEMLRYVTAGPGPRFGLIVHHTDAEREYAYDREAIFGQLDRALDDAKQFGWWVVDMKKDWKRVFPFDS